MRVDRTKIPTPKTTCWNKIENTVGLKEAKAPRDIYTMPVNKPCQHSHFTMHWFTINASISSPRIILPWTNNKTPVIPPILYYIHVYGVKISNWDCASLHSNSQLGDRIVRTTKVLHFEPQRRIELAGMMRNSRRLMYDMITLQFMTLRARAQPTPDSTTIRLFEFRRSDNVITDIAKCNSICKMKVTHSRVTTR